MKQFSLEEYLQNPNRKVVTRDGRAVKILCTDRKDFYQHPIVALVETDGTEQMYDYMADGSYMVNAQSLRDLFFASEKHEGWVNVYKYGSIYYLGNFDPYPSKSEAMNHIMKQCDYVKSLKIEWED